MVGFGSSLRMGRRKGWEQAYLDYEALKLLLSQIEAVYEEEAHGLSWEATQELALYGDISSGIAGQNIAQNGSKSKKAKDFRDELFVISDSDEAFASTSDDEEEDDEDDGDNGNVDDSFSRNATPHVSADFSNISISRILASHPEGMHYNHSYNHNHGQLHPPNMANRDMHSINMSSSGTMNANINGSNNNATMGPGNNAFMPQSRQSLEQPRFSLAYSHDVGSSSSDDSLNAARASSTCSPWWSGKPKARRKRSRNSQKRYNRSSVSSAANVGSGLAPGGGATTTSTGFILNRPGLDDADRAETGSHYLDDSEFGYGSFAQEMVYNKQGDANSPGDSAGVNQDAHNRNPSTIWSIPSASSLLYGSSISNVHTENSPLIRADSTNSDQQQYLFHDDEEEDHGDDGTGVPLDGNAATVDGNVLHTIDHGVGHDVSDATPTAETPSPNTQFYSSLAHTALMDRGLSQGAFVATQLDANDDTDMASHNDGMDQSSTAASDANRNHGFSTFGANVPIYDRFVEEHPHDMNYAYASHNAIAEDFHPHVDQLAHAASSHSSDQPQPNVRRGPRKASRHRRHKRRKNRKSPRTKRKRKDKKRRVPNYIRNAHSRARGITERFLGLLKAEVEKVILFTQARLGELADTAGSLRYLSYDDNKTSSNLHENESTHRYDDYQFSNTGVRIHGSGSSSMDEDGIGNGHFSWTDSSSEDGKGSVSSGRPPMPARPASSRGARGHGRTMKRVRSQSRPFEKQESRSSSKYNATGRQSRRQHPIQHNPSYDLENETFETTRKQIEYFAELRRNRPIFQRHDHITGEDLLLISAVDEADSFTAVGVELLHILRYICINLMAVRKICRKHDQLLANRMLGGYYYRKLAFKEGPQEDKTLGGLVSRAIDGIGEAGFNAVYDRELRRRSHYKLAGVYDKKLQDLANSRTVEVVFSCVSMALSEYEVSMIRADAMAQLNPVSGRNAAADMHMPARYPSAFRSHRPSARSADMGNHTAGYNQSYQQHGGGSNMNVNSANANNHYGYNADAATYGAFSHAHGDEYEMNGIDADVDSDPDRHSDSDCGDSSYAPSTASNAPITRLRFTVLSIAALREAARHKVDSYGAFVSRSLVSYTGRSIAGEGLDGCSREALEFVVAYNPDAALLLEADTLYSSLRVSRWTKEASIVAMMRSALSVGADTSTMDAVLTKHGKGRGGSRRPMSALNTRDDLDAYTYTQHARLEGIDADVDSLSILPKCGYSSQSVTQHSHAFSKPRPKIKARGLAQSKNTHGYGYGYGYMTGLGSAGVDLVALLEAMAPIETTTTNTYRLSPEAASPVWFRLNRFTYFLFSANYYAMHASANGLVRRMQLPEALSAVIIGSASFAALISAIMQSSVIDSHSNTRSRAKKKRHAHTHAHTKHNDQLTDNVVEPFRALLLFGAGMCVIGNSLYAYGVASQGALYIIGGRLLIGLGSCEVVHRQFAIKFVPPSLLVGESAGLVHSRLVGAVFGLLLGSLDDGLVPARIDLAGYIRFQFNAVSCVLAMTWFIHFFRLLVYFRPRGHGSKSRANGKVSERNVQAAATPTIGQARSIQSFRAQGDSDRKLDSKSGRSDTASGENADRVFVVDRFDVENDVDNGESSKSNHNEEDDGGDNDGSSVMSSGSDSTPDHASLLHRQSPAHDSTLLLDQGDGMGMSRGSGMDSPISMRPSRSSTNLQGSMIDDEDDDDEQLNDDSDESSERASLLSTVNDPSITSQSRMQGASEADQRSLASRRRQRMQKKQRNRAKNSDLSNPDRKKSRRLKTTLSRMIKILKCNMAVSVSAGIIFYASYCQEVLFTSCALITNRYFAWPGYLAGCYLAILFLLILPTELVGQRISQRREERTILKRSLLFVIIGFLVMINWGSLFALTINVRALFTVAKDERQHHYDWLLGHMQYVIGCIITFIAIVSSEITARSLLSKSSPPSTHVKGAMTSIGTVMTFLCIVARLVGDLHILAVGLSHRLINADIVNSLVMPMFIMCFIVLRWVRKHYFFLL